DMSRRADDHSRSLPDSPSARHTAENAAASAGLLGSRSTDGMSAALARADGAAGASKRLSLLGASWNSDGGLARDTSSRGRRSYRYSCTTPAGCAPDRGRTLDQHAKPLTPSDGAPASHPRATSAKPTARRA